MPPLEEGNLWIRAILPRTSSLEEAARMAPRLREVIASIPEIRGVMSQVGRPDDGTDVTSFFNLEFNAPLIADGAVADQAGRCSCGHELWRRTITREEIQDELMEKFEEFPAVNFNFSQLIRDNVEEALSGVKGANSVKLFGTDLEVLERYGQQVAQHPADTVRGIENVGLFHIVGQPNLEIQIDRQAVRPLRDQRRRRRGGRPGGHRRPGLHADGRGGEALRHRAPPADRPARRPGGHRPDPGRRPRRRTASPGRGSPCGSSPTIDPHKPGASYIYRENNRRYHPDQVQRPGPRPGLGHRTRPRRKVDDPKYGADAPDGLRHRLVGRVRTRCSRPTAG